jgi:hypothetical protein
MRVELTDTLIDAFAEAIHNECGAHRTDGSYCKLSDEMKAPYRQMVKGIIGTIYGLGYHIHYSDFQEEARLRTLRKKK